MSAPVPFVFPNQKAILCDLRPLPLSAGRVGEISPKTGALKNLKEGFNASSGKNCGVGRKKVGCQTSDGRPMGVRGFSADLVIYHEFAFSGGAR